MNKSRLIDSLIKKHKQYQNDKPKYKIKDLYVGKIVLQTRRDFTGVLRWTTYYSDIKQFGIFYKKNDSTYIHIKSGQRLKSINDYYSIVGDYAIENLQSFEEKFVCAMRQNNLNQNSKLSKNFVSEIETEVNQQINPYQQETLFGL